MHYNVLACGGICGCKVWAQVGGWIGGSQPDAITAMLSAGIGPHMWPLPNLAQAGFGNVLAGIHQNSAWKHANN